MADLGQSLSCMKAYMIRDKDVGFGRKDGFKWSTKGFAAEIAISLQHNECNDLGWLWKGF